MLSLNFTSITGEEEDDGLMKAAGRVSEEDEKGITVGEERKRQKW